MAIPEPSRALSERPLRGTSELPRETADSSRQPRSRSSWLRQPQNTWTRKALFQLHLWSGLILGLYIVVVCVSGSALVFRNDIYSLFEKWIRAGTATQETPTIRIGYIALRWFGDLHGKLLMGANGILVNAVGGFLTAAVCVTGLVIWWPGITRWRRALIVTGGVGWKRLNFDLHSAVGFWTFLILFMWGMTGGYFVFPEPFRAVINYFTPIDAPRLPAPQGTVPQGTVRQGAAPQGNPLRAGAASAPQVVAGGTPVAPRGPFPRRRRPLTRGGKILQWFSFLHYGNFGGWPVKALWTLLGFAPVALYVTALVMWWNRVLSPALRRSRRSQRGWAEAPASVAPELEWERE